MITRRQSTQTRIGSVKIGGNAPIVIQSMTNTNTADVDATVQQIQQLASVGSELVRLSVDTEASANQVSTIRKKLDAIGCNVPLIGDFHYNGHTLLEKYPNCAKALAKYRINPGNVGFGEKKEQQFSAMIKHAIQYEKPIRIGVNWGSIDQRLLTTMMDKNTKLANPAETKHVVQEALITSALDSAEKAQALGLAQDQIVLSCKLSDVQQLIQVYRALAKKCDYPLHVGLTEAGIGNKGIISSTAALAILLQEGIGDTIRISLTPTPHGNRSDEVIVAQEILQALGARHFTPTVIACPGCGRTSSIVFQELADSIQTYNREQMPKWRTQHIGVEKMQIAVMGCVVNGPGESKHANIGISLPGNGETPIAPVFIDGKKTMTLRGNNIAESFFKIIDNYIENTYPRK